MLDSLQKAHPPRPLPGQPSHDFWSALKASMKGWTHDNLIRSVEEQIEEIVKSLEQIKTEQRKHYEAIEELRRSHVAHVKKVAEEAKVANEKLQADLESLHTSNLMPSLVGLVWLTVGLTMSTLAPEFVSIAIFLKHILICSVFIFMPYIYLYCVKSD